VTTHQYAIRMPNGKLYATSPYVGYNAPPPEVAVWSNQNSAQQALESLRHQAQNLGVEDWLGVVVQRICSEFTTTDPVGEFAGEIEKWAAEQ